MREAHLITGFALVAAVFLSGCRTDQQAVQNSTVSSLTLPSGTAINVALSTPLTSETAGVGTTWTGTISNALVVDGRNVVPAGSSVAGTVSSVKPAHKGDRAMIDLELTTIVVEGRSYRVHGNMESIVAGSPRARNLGVIGAATVVGAVVGHQVGGSNTGTVVGGLIGGGAATAAVSQTDGWQVVLKSGMPLTFTTSGSIAVRG